MTPLPPLALAAIVVLAISSVASVEGISVSADKLKFDIERGDTQLLFR